MMINDHPTTFESEHPLPGHARMDGAVSDALPALLPPTRMSVSEAAAMRMVEAGGYWTEWDTDEVPYMREPQDMVTSRVYDSLCFVGPARSGKTEAVIKNPIAHAIIAAPRLVHVVHMGRNEAREWSIQEIGPMINRSEELSRRMARRASANNVFDKEFTAGCRLTIGWPVVSQLSARSIPLVLITDFDRIPDDIEGEGSAFQLGRKRTTSHQSRGMTVVEASPGRPILDESWEAKSPHEAPPTTGILSIYNTGTRGRWYWHCRDCGNPFEPSIERLVVPAEGSPAERGAGTVMSCKHCGSVIEPKHKAEFNADGNWLHEGVSGNLVPIGEGVRETDTVSYWLMGPAAAFATWAKITTKRLDAEAIFDLTGDEANVKSVINTDFGLPYLPRARNVSASLSEQSLREGATDQDWQVAPRGTLFITVAVDVQVGRFVVQVEAWCEDLERSLIDRFDLHAPPSGAPRAKDRRIDPAKYIEDWAVLEDLIALQYDVATEGRALHPVAVIFDSRGEAGVTPNAYTFYRSMRRKHPRRFWPVQGVHGERAKRVEVSTPESAHRGKKFAARDVKIVRANGDRLKDEIAASLLRTEEGSRALHIPRGAPADVFTEFAAERKTEKGWEKKPGQKRNEALDLSVYALALVIGPLAAEKVSDWSKPPKWASPDANRNPFTAFRADKGIPEDQPAKPERKRPRRKPRRRFDGWG